MSKPKEKPPAATEGSNNNITCPQGSDAAAASQPRNMSIEQQAEPPLSSVHVWPAHLAPPEGLVGDLVEYFLDSARYPMEEGAVMAALALMAGIAGRCFNFDGTGLNLYLLVLAESGRGKEDMRGSIDRMLSSVRQQVPMVDDCIGPDTFASGQGLIRTLGRQPCFVSVQSEFGLRLKELTDQRAPSSTVILRRLLLELYGKGGWNSVLGSTAYSDTEKNTAPVVAPALTILGESTPGHVYSHLSFGDIEDGLLPRCLVLECTSDRPRANPNAATMPPKQLSEKFAAFVAMTLAMRNNNTCMPVQATPDATEALKRLQDSLDDRYNDKACDPHDRALWNRAGLNIKRIAALIAVGCMSPGDKTAWVQAAHVEWAVALVTHCVEGLASKFRAGEVGTGETRQEAELKRIAREYLRLTSKARRGYNVPAKLAEVEGALSVPYLRRRASRCNAFKDDRRGFNIAFKSTLQALCDAGWLAKLNPAQVEKSFGARMGDVYVLGAQAD